ncbi:hypothetical protein K456DRAFT_40264 [Colletotrichum gloeosporioides 23]|nr:hypothetical protein K456DRAFT_40264 [Colletotrichum gloeosporioides 23]
MAHAELSSSYRRYKIKTDQALGWVITTAGELSGVKNVSPSHKVLELVGMAQICAAAGKIMPESRKSALREAVALRRRYAKWFQHHGSPAANSAYAFFNDKLQQILDCFSASTPSNTSKGTTTRDKAQSDNFFAVLGDSMDVGVAASDDSEPSQARVAANPKPTIERPNMEPPARPLEELAPIEDDHIMELICLFNDARDVRNFLKRTWTRYAERKTDLVTASLVTQASFQHLTDLELDFSRGYRFDFLDIMFGTLYTFCALGEAKHWLVMPTETEAKAFAYDNMQRITRSGWIPTPEIDDWLMSDTLGMLDSIADVLSKGGQPTEDALRPVLSKCSTNAEHFLPDTRRLAQLHIESKAMQPSFARVDLLASRLRETIQRTRIRMSTAAMCRTSSISTPSVVCSLLLKIDKSSGIQDSLMKAHLDALFPPVNSDQKKLSVRNPLFLGSVLSSLVLKLNSSELSLVTKSGSPMAAAHLYNALRVFNPQTMPRWHDLDLLIELQKEPMFAPEPPTEFAQCVSRFWIAQGLKPSEIVSARMTSRRLALASGRKHPTELYEKRLEGLKRGSGVRRELRTLAEGFDPLKNTPGKRRKLRLAPLLQHLHWMRCITGGWKLSMDEKTVRGAVETDLGKRLGRGQSPPRASDLPVVVWLGQLEKMIQAETPSLFFGFTELEQIMLDSLGSLASTGR